MVAGGIDAEGAAEAVRRGAGIVIVGGWIIRSADVTASARKIRAAMDKPSGTAGEKEAEMKRPESLFAGFGPNITDAMHRKGAMAVVFSICGNVKMVGRAVTVHTIAGDCKAVEAVDVAKQDEVIVINNDGVTYVAPWGELARMNCKRRVSAALLLTGLSGMSMISGP